MATVRTLFPDKYEPHDSRLCRVCFSQRGFQMESETKQAVRGSVFFLKKEYPFRSVKVNLVRSAFCHSTGMTGAIDIVRIQKDL
jgi:hypothetical protein